MGKAAARKRTTSESGDPVVDRLAVIDARNMFFTSLISMGWRLAIMVLVPIFIGVQLDRRLDTKPSFTLAAFFIALIGSAYLIYKNYSDMQREQLLEETKKSKRKVKRNVHA